MFKKYWVINCLFLCGLSMGLAQNIVLKGKIENNAELNELNLYSILLDKPILQQTIKIKKGTVKSSIDLSAVNRGIYRIGESETNSGLIVLYDDEVNFTVNATDFKNSVKIEGSDVLNGLDRYHTITQTFEAELQEINKQAQQAARLRRVNPQESQKQMIALRAKWDSAQVTLNEDFKRLKVDFKHKYIHELADLFIVTESTNKENYLKKEEFLNPIWMSGDMLMRKVNYYTLRFLQLSKLNVEKEINVILGYTKPKSLLREKLYENLINIALSVDKAYAGKLSKVAFEEYPESASLKKIKESFPPGIGDEAPEIVMMNPEGKELKLSDLRGKVVLLDFWASWCGPCIRESPNVVAAYNKYNEKGFEVFGVSLDNNKDRWVGAIQKYNLLWPNHVSDLKKWNSAAGRKYGVSGIPATFLIDENGIIIAKDLRGQKLDATLAQLLSNK